MAEGDSVSGTSRESQESQVDPTGVRNDGGDGATAEEGEGKTADPDTVPAGSAQTGKPASVSTPERFDWRGWLVVAVVFVSFLVIPAFVLYLPDAHWFLTAVGLSRRQAYVVFPMVPAIVLGITAVWAAVRAQSRGR